MLCLFFLCFSSFSVPVLLVFQFFVVRSFYPKFLSFLLFLAGNKSRSIISENHTSSVLCCACSFCVPALSVCALSILHLFLSLSSPRAINRVLKIIENHTSSVLCCAVFLPLWLKAKQKAPLKTKEGFLLKHPKKLFQFV